MTQDLGSLIGFWRTLKEVASFFQNLFSGPNILVEIDEVPNSPEEALKLSLLGYSFVIKVKNYENYPITLSSWGLFIRELKGSFPPVLIKEPITLSLDQYDYAVPYRLPDHESFRVWEQLITVHQHMWAQNFSGVIDVVAHFRDSLDRVYYSKPYRFIIPSRKISF